MIKCKVNNIRCLAFALHAELVNFYKLIVENGNRINTCLKYKIFHLFSYINDLFYRIARTCFDDFSNFILVRNLRIRWWDDLILFESLIFVIGLFYSSDIFNDILCKLRPFKMPITIDINCLKKLDQIRNKVIFRQLILRYIQFFHQINKCWQLQSFRVQLKLFFQYFHVLLTQHCHYSLHVLCTILLLLEYLFVHIKVLD